MADGVIKSIRYARQRADFNGMRFGSITPTDIDGFVEFGNKVFVFIETKHGDSDLPVGQKLALERVCDRVQLSGAQAMVLVLHKHSIGDDAMTYKIAPLPVTRYRYKGKWFEPKDTINALQAIEKFKAKFIEVAPAEVPADPRLQSKDEWLLDYEEASV